MIRRFKRMIPAALLVLEFSGNRTKFSSATSRWLLLLVLLYRLTRKRVYILFHAYLLIQFILLQLICDIFLYRFFVAPYRIHVVPSAPKMPIPVLVFQVRKLVEYHQATLPFEYPLKFAYAQFRRDRYQLMDVIFTRVCFDNFYSVTPLAYSPQHLSYRRFIFSIYI